MKKRFILAFMTFFFCCLAQVKAENSKIDWGMKLSLDVELPGKWRGQNMDITMFKPGIGVSIGAIMRINLPKNFYFEPGATLFHSCYKYKDLVITGSNGEVIEKDPKLTKWGFQIPLMVGYGFNISKSFGLDIYTGPQIRYAFAGKIDIKNKNIRDEIGNTFDLWGVNGQRRFDCSWKIGVGIPINNSLLSLEADLGITDLLKESMSFRENRIGLGFTKFF